MKDQAMKIEKLFAQASDIRIRHAVEALLNDLFSIDPDQWEENGSLFLRHCYHCINILLFIETKGEDWFRKSKWNNPSFYSSIKYISANAYPVIKSYLESEASSQSFDNYVDAVGLLHEMLAEAIRFNRDVFLPHIRPLEHIIQLHQNQLDRIHQEEWQSE